MARILKADTAFTFRIGPFLDEDDGKTIETGLSIAQADIQISKNGAAFAQTSASSPTTTHDADGWYQCPLTTSDTDTEGPLTVQIHMTGALPVWEHFMVVNANVYDSLYAAAATDYLQVDMLQIGGDSQSGTDLKDFADAGYDPATNKVQGVVLTDTCTTNTDMRGTDSALLASSAPTNFGDLAITVTTGRVTVGTNEDKTGYSISGSKTTLDALNDIAATDIVSGGNVIDVTAGGCVGIDWANIESPTTAVDLSGTDIQLVDTCTTNSDMRGTDSALLAASAPTNFGDLSITATTGRVDVGSWLGTAVTTSSTSAKPEVDAYSVSDDATAANDLELLVENSKGTDHKVLLSTDSPASDLSDQVPPNVNACGVEEKINYLYGALIYQCHVDSDSKDFYNASATNIWSKVLSDDGTDYNEADASS